MNFKLMVHRWSTKTQIVDKRHDRQGQSTCRKVTWSSSCSISRERKVPETPKLSKLLQIPRVINRASFKVERSKVKATRPSNAEFIIIV